MPGSGQLSPSAGELAPSCGSKRTHVFGFLNPFNKAGECPVSFRHRGLVSALVLRESLVARFKPRHPGVRPKHTLPITVTGSLLARRNEGAPRK